MPMPPDRAPDEQRRVPVRLAVRVGAVRAPTPLAARARPLRPQGIASTVLNSIFRSHSHFRK